MSRRRRGRRCDLDVPWFVRVTITVGSQIRHCLIGPLPAWRAARRLADAWEREFGHGTATTREGLPPGWSRAAGSDLRIIPRMDVAHGQLALLQDPSRPTVA